MMTSVVYTVLLPLSIQTLFDLHKHVASPTDIIFSIRRLHSKHLDRAHIICGIISFRDVILHPSLNQCWKTLFFEYLAAIRCSCICTHWGQWFFFGRNIGYFTPEIILIYPQKWNAPQVIALDDVMFVFPDFLLRRYPYLWNSSGTLMQPPWTCVKKLGCSPL